MIYIQLLGQAKKEFPYYLNHLAILIQNNPVPNAIEKSIREAPAIFQEDLRVLARGDAEAERYFLFWINPPD